MADSFDVIVLGGGSAGTATAAGLVERGKSVALLESDLVGGECPYLACMPSKAMLHAASARWGWPHTTRFRDEVAEHQDDSDTAKALEENGITVVRERGVITGHGVVRAGGHDLHCHDLVIATGAQTSPPDVPGLGTVAFWTSDDALTAKEQPPSLVILGGGPVGCELAQAYARLGTSVAVVEPAATLLPSEPSFIGQAIAEALRRDGVEVHVGTTPSGVAGDDDGIVVHLDRDVTVTGARLLVATGKKPRVDDLGLSAVGVVPNDDGAIDVDEHCRVAPHVWAAGDVTGVAPFTHTANYQAAIVAANICGDVRRADYRAIPRVVYTDPAVFCVGRTDDHARQATMSVGETARAVVEQRRDGQVTVYADNRRIVGAAVVGPDADHWAAELTLAIRANVEVDVLRDVIHAFPTFSEALAPTYVELCEAFEGRRDT